jgi:arylformamidase
MSFDDLPPLPPMNYPEANGYAERCMAASRRAQAEGPVRADLKYGADYWQKLDIYLPRKSVPKGAPVLIFLHGGAWTNGTKEWMGFMAPPLVELPSLFVAANYRLAPAVRFPGQLEDCCDVVAWVHAHITEYGGDPGRIFIGGHSAGGHLAAMTALSADRLAAHGLPEDVIKGCLPISGSFDLRAPDATPESAEARILRTLLARPEDAAAASPILFIRGRRVPFLIAYGSRDFPRLVTQAEAMSAALARETVPATVLTLDGLDHFGANEACAVPDAIWVRTTRQWLARSEACAESLAP